MRKPRDPDLLSTRDAALLLLLSDKEVQRRVDDGRIQGTKTKGGHRRIHRTVVESMLAGE